MEVPEKSENVQMKSYQVPVEYIEASIMSAEDRIKYKEFPVEFNKVQVKCQNVLLMYTMYTIVPVHSGNP